MMNNPLQEMFENIIYLRVYKNKHSSIIRGNNKLIPAVS